MALCREQNMSIKELKAIQIFVCYKTLDCRIILGEYFTIFITYKVLFIYITSVHKKARICNPS